MKAVNVKSWWPAVIFLGLAAALIGGIVVRQLRPDGGEGAGGFGFEDGDRIVFIGDSITSQCLYTQFIEAYCYTRYSGRRLHFRNAGVGGDRLANVWERFDDDIASFDPDHAFVLMGMNDGGLRDFDEGIFLKFQKGMVRLLDRLEALDVRVIVISPTMFDLQSAKAAALEASGAEEWNPAADRYDAVLAKYGVWLREECARRGHDFVDVHGPLSEATFRGRQDDPEFSLIGDGVHPDEPGHEVMVGAILEQMGEMGGVEDLVVERGDGSWVLRRRPEEGEFRELDTVAGLPTFTYRMPGLYDLRGLGSGRLVISGLEPGHYDLRLDGESAGVWTGAQWGRGVGVSEFAETAPSRQAVEVARLNAERTERAIKPLRDAWFEVKVKWYEFEETPAAFEEWFSKKRVELIELEAIALGYEDEIYMMNQPKPHEYRLRRVVSEEE